MLRVVETSINAPSTFKEESAVMTKFISSSQLKPLTDDESVRDYYITHAPLEPQKWFIPFMEAERPKDGFLDWDREFEKQRYLQWPIAWADEMLKTRFDVFVPYERTT